MNKKVVFVVAVTALAACVTVLSTGLAQVAVPAAPAKPAGANVAVCDVVKVFNEYQRAKDLTLKLNERRDALKTENDKRGNAIKLLQTELEGLKIGSKDYEQRLNEVQRLSIERQAWLQFQDALIMRDHQRLTREMYEQILKMIQDVARDQGYSVVIQHDMEPLDSQNTQELIQKIASRKLLFCEDAVNLTDTVLGKLNETYRLSGAATTTAPAR